MSENNNISKRNEDPGPLGEPARFNKRGFRIYSYAEQQALRDRRLAMSPEARAKEKAEQDRIHKERRRANMEKAREAVRIRMAQRRAAQAKVDAGMKISEEEREHLLFRMGPKGSSITIQRPDDLVAATAKILLKPKHSNELRLLVEKTALEHSYNPMAELIKLTKPSKREDGSTSYPVDAETRVQIHKALMPFLIPQLSAAKVQDSSQQETGVRVTVTSFVFPEDKEVKPIFAEAPKMVDVADDARDIAPR